MGWKKLPKAQPCSPSYIPCQIDSFNFFPRHRESSVADEPECVAPRGPRDITDLSQKTRRRSALTTSGRLLQRSLMSNLSLKRPADMVETPAICCPASPLLSTDSSLSDRRMLNAGLDAFGKKNIKSSAVLVYRGLRVRVGLHTGVRFTTDLVYSEVGVVCIFTVVPRYFSRVGNSRQPG